MSLPVVCMIDIQKEYTSEERSFFIPGIDVSLKQAHTLLVESRKKGCPIIHVKHLQTGEIFNKESPYSDYVSGFEPLSGEHEIIKDNFSCFSSSMFTELLAQYSDRDIVIAGYGSSMCCLSTIIEGYHRGYRMVFAKDASSAKPTTVHTSTQVHQVMSDVLSTFARSMLVAEIMKTF